jgi:dipeptidyl-peptidase-3
MRWRCARCSKPSSRIPRGIETATLAEVQRYTKLFWINNGPYNNLTSRKFVLKATPQAFATAAQIAAKTGATFPTRGGESLDALLKRLEPMFFDADVDPIVTNKNPGPGKDILTASANNLYSGVSMADLKGFTEKNGLNSRLVNTNGRLTEEVYSIKGRYAKEIADIVKHLEAAIPFASEPTAVALKAWSSGTGPATIATARSTTSPG